MSINNCVILCSTIPLVNGSSPACEKDWKFRCNWMRRRLRQFQEEERTHPPKEFFFLIHRNDSKQSTSILQHSNRHWYYNNNKKIIIIHGNRNIGWLTTNIQHIYIIQQRLRLKRGMTRAENGDQEAKEDWKRLPEWMPCGSVLPVRLRWSPNVFHNAIVRAV